MFPVAICLHRFHNTRYGLIFAEGDDEILHVVALQENAGISEHGEGHVYFLKASHLSFLVRI